MLVAFLWHYTPLETELHQQHLLQELLYYIFFLNCYVGLVDESPIQCGRPRPLIFQPVSLEYMTNDVDSLVGVASEELMAMGVWLDRTKD